MIRQLQKKNETLQQIRESEQFIDSAAANIQGADFYIWKTGARPKASTPARTWADVIRHKGKSNRKSVKRAPTLTPPLELSLQNRYDALAPNEMCGNTNYTEPREANHTCGIKAIQNANTSPKTTARPRARKNYANTTPEKPRARRNITNPTPERPRASRTIPNFTSDQPDTILIGDSITKHVRMAKTENLTVSDTSVRELTELLPVILSTHPSNMRIIIYAGSFDILQRKTDSEILKKLSDCLSQNVFISGPIPTLGKGIESFTRLLALNTWLTSACFTHGIKFIDNFNVFWNCKDRFQRDGIHPNITGCRLLGANLRHALGMPYQNKNGQ
ncbi:hypothetical protein ABVT39_014914 [Epinephelus coioides]